MNNQTTQPVGFINFHGLTLLVVRYQGEDYVAAKPLSDLAGLAWRKTRDTLVSGDNLQLLGTKRIPDALFLLRDGSYEASNNSLEDPSTPQNADITARNSIVCIKLDRARMYLARVNTNQMRVQGNETGADKLLALQIEWAKVLHDYETQGYALKADRKSSISELLNLIKIRDKASPQEKKWISVLISEQARALGIPESMLAEEQNDLFE